MWVVSLCALWFYGPPSPADTSPPSARVNFDDLRGLVRGRAVSDARREHLSERWGTRMRCRV